MVYYGPEELNHYYAALRRSYQNFFEKLVPSLQFLIPPLYLIVDNECMHSDQQWAFGMICLNKVDMSYHVI